MYEQLQVKILRVKKKLTTLTNGKKEWRNGKPDKKREVSLPNQMMGEMLKMMMMISCKSQI